ncbi:MULTISPECIES: S1C family serine protease [Frankia]|uniref:Peptidase S1 and S6, chymotrypsin/Hap n=1 Tax=Frankia casuarinae (strain DSM 45818 / CECT 9043 / HFP020203 / CcI3) TaxID=106370 RepID=Q2JBI0_FRACC|nr:MULTISPECIES: trypsin-like peptidase domain-containing protein [Frankia]ABD11362.1 peptidase S1 and S6, chymotrypsin/Hap [Frankia casuarinae]
MSRLTGWISGIVAAAAMLVGATGCGTGGGPGSPTADRAAAADRAGLGAVAGIVSDVEPSVVTILVGNELGSGIVYRADGVIVTNQHVIAQASGGKAEVAFADGRRVAGRVQAADEISDIAVVKVNRTGLPAATFRKDLPQVGELAVAIGSPLGFENSVTAGIISGVNRNLPVSGQQGGQGRPLVDLIQTDAAISPGNSGGALLDSQGRVVGINEAYIPPSTGASSLGFAIPSATAVDAVEQLLRTGTVKHAFVGVQLATLTSAIAERLGLDVRAGALVLAVVRGGPAGKAGVLPGDVIRSFNGKSVASAGEFSARLREVSPGDMVTLGVHRDGRDHTVQVRVSDRPG